MAQIKKSKTWPADKFQNVIVNGVSSFSAFISSGDPQRSGFALFIYNIFIKDLEENIK